MTAMSLGIGAWGLVTAMAMVKSGLGVPLSLLMTFTVYAGSAQLAALPLLAAGAPLWLLWATAFCVNLRFVIFSAQWRPYLMHLGRWPRLLHGYMTTDMNFVLFMKRHPRPALASEPALREAQSAYFWGGVLSNWVAWQSASCLGIALADRIPTTWGIGFAGTLALVGLICSLVHDKATVMAAAVSATAAVVAVALPLKLNLVVAIAAAVAMGVVWDHRVNKETA